MDIFIIDKKRVSFVKVKNNEFVIGYRAEEKDYWFSFIK